MTGSSTASSSDQELLGRGRACPASLNLGSHGRARTPGVRGLRTVPMPSVPQTSGMVATSSSGSSWTESSSRSSSRMSGAWTLTWPRWKTSTSRMSSTCELQLASDLASASSASLPLGSPSKTSAPSPTRVRLQKLCSVVHRSPCPVGQLG